MRLRGAPNPRLPQRPAFVSVCTASHSDRTCTRPRPRPFPPHAPAPTQSTPATAPASVRRDRAQRRASASTAKRLDLTATRDHHNRDEAERAHPSHPRVRPPLRTPWGCRAIRLRGPTSRSCLLRGRVRIHAVRVGVSFGGPPLNLAAASALTTPTHARIDCALAPPPRLRRRTLASTTPPHTRPCVQPRPLRCRPAGASLNHTPASWTHAHRAASIRPERGRGARGHVDATRTPPRIHAACARTPNTKARTHHGGAVVSASRCRAHPTHASGRTTPAHLSNTRARTCSSPGWPHTTSRTCPTGARAPAVARRTPILRGDLQAAAPNNRLDDGVLTGMVMPNVYSALIAFMDDVSRHGSITQNVDDTVQIKKTLLRTGVYQR
jgi:hypothetical protein